MAWLEGSSESSGKATQLILLETMFPRAERHRWTGVFSRSLKPAEYAQILHNSFALFMNRNDIKTVIQEHQLFFLERDLISDDGRVAGASHVILKCLENACRIRLCERSLNGRIG